MHLLTLRATVNSDLHLFDHRINRTAILRVVDEIGFIEIGTDEILINSSICFDRAALAQTRVDVHKRIRLITIGNPNITPLAEIANIEDHQCTKLH